MKRFKIKGFRKLPKVVLSFVLTILMLVSNASVIIAGAMDAAYTQARLEDVLSTDMSQYEGARMPVEADKAQEETITPIDTLRIDPDYETDRFIVVYKESAGTSEKTALDGKLTALPDVDAVQKADALVKDVAGLSGASIVKTDEAISASALNEQLTKSAGASAVQQIAYIQPDYLMDMSSLEASLEAIDSVAIPSRTTGGLDVTVALLDSGIDTNHTALAGKLLPGWDFVNGDNSVNDDDWYYDQGHGTHLASVIARSGASVLPLKIFQGGYAYTSDILAAIAYAEAQGADIVNMSFGSMHYNPALEQAIAASDMLFVCAAGNLLVNNDNYPMYPASLDLPNVLSVSSVDADNRLSRFSNYGPVSVLIAAPGEGVTGAWLDGGTVAQSGTSVAAAVVSAAAAQVLGEYDQLDAASLRTRMLMAADSVTGLLDKINSGKLLNLEYALSDEQQANAALLDVLDDEELPEIIPNQSPEDEYEQFGAEGLVTVKAQRTSYQVSSGALHTVGDKLYSFEGTTSATSNAYSIPNAYMYDPALDTWPISSSLSSTLGAQDFASTAVGDKIYRFGGVQWPTIPKFLEYKNNTIIINTQNFENSSTISSSGASLPAAFAGATAVHINGYIYVMGGCNGSSYLNTVYRYNVNGSLKMYKKGGEIMYRSGVRDLTFQTGCC